MKSLVVTNQKGGVAKTTTAVTIAHALALRGKRTLLVDFDPQGQSAVALGVPPEPGVFNLLLNPTAPPLSWLRPARENLKLLPGNAETATAQIVLNAQNRSIDCIRQALKPLESQFDWMVFDTAPSVGGIQERAIWAANLVVIPVATDYLAVDGLGKTITLLTTLANSASWKGKLLGILPTFYDSVTRESKNALAYLKNHYPALTLPPIHRATILRECVSSTQTIWEKDAMGQPARDYETLIKSIMRQ
jgi:chromosome partitioning protein